MRRAVWAIGIVAALVTAAPAAAGCFATVGLAPLPRGVAAGETWTVELRVLQHGRTPLADARPVLSIENVPLGLGLGLGLGAAAVAAALLLRSRRGEARAPSPRAP